MSTANYGDPNYWNIRYAQCDGDMFDWLENYESLQSLLELYIKKDHRILITGCGNARFSEDLYDAGYKNIWNIDISEVVIEQMKERNKNRTNMYYEVMDVCQLKYPDNFFDIVIDKSIIDTLLCGNNAFVYTALMLKEGQRVIKENGGIYFAVSYGTPATRTVHFRRDFLSWTVKDFILHPDKKDLTE